MIIYLNKMFINKLKKLQKYLNLRILSNNYFFKNFVKIKNFIIIFLFKQKNKYK